MVFNAKEFTKQGINVPVLIGGATTSKMHTAVKIEPYYKNNLALHVLDASRSVVVVQNLMDPVNSDDYKRETREEYETLRTQYFEGLQDKSYVSLLKARTKKMPVDWRQVDIKEPSFIGPKVF